MSISVLTAGYTSPIVSSGSGGGGIAYAYSVNTYADLPTSPVDGLVIKVLAETDIQPSYLRYDTGLVSWFLVLGFITNPAQLPAETINVAPPVACGSNSTIISNAEVGYLWNGASWVELNPVPTDFVSETTYANVAALETAYPAASNNLKYGLATRNSVTSLYRSNGADWLTQVSDGSVTTFSALPTDVADGTRYEVTGETGLSNCFVVWNESGALWEMDQVTAAYSVYSAIEWATTPGEWYNTGGIEVNTLLGCELQDTTNKRTFYWNSTNSVFVPYDVYAGTLANVQKIKGDSTSPTGWVNGTAAGGGTATATTDGSKITLASSNPGSGGTSLAGYYYDDTSIVTGANVYLKGMFAISTPTGNQARAAIIVADGTDAFDFGSARGGGSTQATGQWFDGSSGSYAAYTAVAAGTETVSSEVFIEFQKKSSYAQVRVNGGIWRAISGATARSSTATQVYILALSNVNGATSATMTLRHVASMRY